MLCYEKKKQFMANCAGQPDDDQGTGRNINGGFCRGG